jgi:hypothetical protein
MTIQLTLKPHPSTREIVEMYDEHDHPFALAHVDVFWTVGRENRNIYEALAEGETVKVELRMVIDPCLDPQ